VTFGFSEVVCVGESTCIAGRMRESAHC
jgi:hypothetical protein